MVLKLCLAQGLATYHQQVSAVLKGPVELKNVAPELLSVDRTNLGHSIRLKLPLETELKTAARILKQYPSKSNPPAPINSPPGTGDRKRSEPLTNASTDNKSGQATPSNKKKGQNLLGTIEEDSSEKD